MVGAGLAISQAPSLWIADWSFGIAKWRFFYIRGAANRIPAYAVNPTEVLATDGDLSSDLAISWRGKTVPNVCVKRIALWNDGTLPITGSNLPQSDALRLIPSKPVEILFVQVAASSRKRLLFTTRIALDEESKRSVVYIGIDGGDGLEKNDGGEFRIVYSGDRDTDFRVEGRVVGVAGGFTLIKTASREREPSNFTERRWTSILFIGAVPPVSLIYLFMSIVAIRAGMRLGYTNVCWFCGHGHLRVLENCSLYRAPGDFVSLRLGNRPPPLRGETVYPIADNC